MYLKNYENYLNKKIKIFFKINENCPVNTEEVVGVLKHYYPPENDSTYESCLSLRVDYIPHNSDFTYVVVSSLIDKIYLFEDYDNENKNSDLLLDKLHNDIINHIKSYFKTGFYLIKN